MWLTVIHQYFSKSRIYRLIHMIDHLFYELSHKTAGQGIRQHAHPFWQLELLRAGRISSTVAGLDYVSAPGDLLFIPPETAHSLVCKEGPAECLIVKFRAEATARRPVHITGSTLAVATAEALCELLPDPPRPLQANPKHQAELLLQVLFHHAYPPDKEPGRGLKERIDAHLARREGGYVTVEEIAKLAGYSVSHTSRLFRDAHGQSLKQYLDRKRADFSRNLLRYSELTIAEVAQRQEFNDLSAFSRFVRRHLGASPREIQDA